MSEMLWKFEGGKHRRMVLVWRPPSQPLHQVLSFFSARDQTHGLEEAR